MNGIQSAREQCLGVIGALGTVYHHARHILDSINPDRWAPKHQLLLNQRRRVFGTSNSRCVHALMAIHRAGTMSPASNSVS